jgi:hypothetical protein
MFYHVSIAFARRRATDEMAPDRKRSSTGRESTNTQASGAKFVPRIRVWLSPERRNQQQLEFEDFQVPNFRIYGTWMQGVARTKMFTSQPRKCNAAMSVPGPAGCDGKAIAMMCAIGHRGIFEAGEQVPGRRGDACLTGRARELKRRIAVIWTRAPARSPKLSPRADRAKSRRPLRKTPR